jgi:predicted phosphodiesterase
MNMSTVKQLGELRGPLLIFGGPYSNLQATQAMKAVAEDLDIPAQNAFCTGDIVAYCGEPFETVELIRDWGVQVVMGNCEESLVSEAPDCGCGFEAGTTCSLLSVGWYRYAQGQVTAEQKQWMQRLPSRIDLSLAGRSIALVHGGVSQINQFFFPSTAEKVKAQELALAKVDVVVGGHSGIPFGDKVGEGAWLNSGVLGMPANDATADGWYLILEEENAALKASWHRLTYDAPKASQVMQEVGLRGDYQEALLTGLWPSMDILPEQEKSQRGVPIARPTLTL